MPWYLPRSRNGITSAIRAEDVTSRPPAPRPWTARNRISHSMLLAKPQKNEPTMNTTTLARNMFLRPKMSPNLPTSAVDTVSASR